MTPSDHDLLIRVDDRTQTTDKNVADLKKMMEEWAKTQGEQVTNLRKDVDKLQDHEAIVIGCVVVGLLGSGLIVWVLSKIIC